ncbi:MAG: UDP-N-acetylmuramate--L-alanine ligase, partial [Spirochaetales bacterium]|nr:UDP-N-acetylmuramate--L-alanine ligase [Spirochaetales bacterium]
YCADDPGACRAAAEASRRRPGLTLIPYGFTAPGPWGIENYRPAAGQSRFTLRALSREFTLRVPGRHNVNNAAGASAAVWELAREKYPERAAGELGEAFCRGLEGFAGSARRCEVLGEAGGVLFLDDYAHHPSAIKTTLKGIREFYPGRRLVVDFMSHTYSRTAALFEDFAASFEAADLLLLHKIYPSARETAQGFSVSGESLFRRIASSREGVFYFEEPLEALDFCLARLREGDLFITLGAGNNGVLGRELYRIRGGKE